MYATTPSDREQAAASPAPPSRLLRRLLATIDRGRLTVVMPSGKRIDHAGSLPGSHGRIEFHNRRALLRMATGGDIGLAEGFMAGEWLTPDLTALLMLGAENIDGINAALDGFAPVRWLRRLGHALRSNSLRGSRRNIAFHYDLGNDFYRLWLDRDMMYSSACEVAPGQSLEDAQAARLERIAELLRIGGGESVLEIGCGWGALATRLAERGARVTGLTLSREQLAHGGKRIVEHGVAGKVDLALRDYREETGRYDRIVSIEMIEAVGEQWWPTYFERLKACLNPGGRVVIQAITIREDRFEAYRRSPDFIQRYIFPGGMLMTHAIIAEQAARAGLRLMATETFAEGYAQTLAEWRGRFLAAEDAVAALGFDARFRRLWEYYLCYCEAGFRAGTIDVGFHVLEHAA